MYNKKSIIKQFVGITSATILMTLAVTTSTGHAAQNNQSKITSSQSLNKADEVRQITRIIKIDEPYKGMQTVKQTVVFKKVADQWQALTPNFWSSFFVPNYDDFEPNIVQVRAQPVTADNQGETITVTYHQYKIPDQQRLVEFRHTFYGYDNNFKFSSVTWNSNLVKVGQWYDFPSAPEGFEYCQSELLPKRLKLYRTNQEPFRLLIQPTEKNSEQVVDKHEEQLGKDVDEDNLSMGTHTNLNTNNDSETRTEQPQQTISPERKDGEEPTKQPENASSNQEGDLETSTHDNQTEALKTKEQKNQTPEPAEKEGNTQTASNNKEQITQRELISHNNEEAQSEKRTEQGQQTDSPESTDETAQTDQFSENSAIPTAEAEKSSQVSSTDEITTPDRAPQTEGSATKEESSQTDFNGVEQTTQTELIPRNNPQNQNEGNTNQGQQTYIPESGDGELQITQTSKGNISQTAEVEKSSAGSHPENVTTDDGINYQEEPESSENKTAALSNLEDSQIEKHPQNEESPNNARSNHRSLEMNDASIQQLLDRDSTSLKELHRKKKQVTANQGKSTILPQTGNQTDNKTTLGGIIITGLVTSLTAVFWKHRGKKGEKAKKDLHF
ncbi:LPXTG cell wall anchor domain-containing protein [Limosilactobacillus fastidiosus]|uniref:LPXTG cell wall anchor domain-containing protein n=1 Tax=Limosilactobacillus fastidiosus TaxID=2759855 RepID=A0A7W3TZU1_9LACO|nr:LPXTG cell wall anchor domain-containing protein [Limosilactobacillus fastidiosus]MBB1086321.1 LPXTG cell wall anchor domain-containing protein [Limosilactobacillus fastidiosus]MCD7086426.1 LPXTG cell wall anchor domain-containing protein [Limosilactobacillus fastidiosus]MCD7114218.1 LPXTG cell wall anchor domain-containing protein [Limosilactobacillus fastidiosus]MCD7116125.1 LPXTG cell wall anchor domain-containing protein [Limosilactobacillus fastidiosus]